MVVVFVIFMLKKKLISVRSQNHRIAGGGRDLQGSSSLTPGDIQQSVIPRSSKIHLKSCLDFFFPSFIITIVFVIF